MAFAPLSALVRPRCFRLSDVFFVNNCESPGQPRLFQQLRSPNHGELTRSSDVSFDGEASHRLPRFIRVPTRTQENMEISPIANITSPSDVQISLHIFRCSPTLQNKWCKHSAGRVFFFPLLYPFAAPKFWLHTLPDVLFSRVVSPAQDPIRSALFLQDKLTGAIKAHSTLKNIRLFRNAGAHVRVRVNPCTRKSMDGLSLSFNVSLYWLNGTLGPCWDLWDPPPAASSAKHNVSWRVSVFCYLLAHTVAMVSPGGEAHVLVRVMAGSIFTATIIKTPFWNPNELAPLS